MLDYRLCFWAYYMQSGVTTVGETLGSVLGKQILKRLKILVTLPLKHEIADDDAERLMMHRLGSGAHFLGPSRSFPATYDALPVIQLEETALTSTQ